MARYCRDQEQQQLIPAWTGFNVFTTEKQVPVAAVRYLPLIQASPSDLSTICTALLQLIAIAEKFKHLGHR
jgi:hypothetical protein